MFKIKNEFFVNGGLDAIKKMEEIEFPIGMGSLAWDVACLADEIMQKAKVYRGRVEKITKELNDRRKELVEKHGIFDEESGQKTVKPSNPAFKSILEDQKMQTLGEQAEKELNELNEQESSISAKKPTIKKDDLDKLAVSPKVFRQLSQVIIVK